MGSEMCIRDRTKKDTKRTRRLRAGGYADTTNVDAIRKMIPYK